MTTSTYNISTYSRFNLDVEESDIHVFVKEYKERIKLQLSREEENLKNPFISFAEKRLSVAEINWLQENERRFFKGTPNERILQLDYLSALGYIFCMVYSPDGGHIIVGFSSGLIQVLEMANYQLILEEFKSRLNSYYENENSGRGIWYPLFYKGRTKWKDRYQWVKDNYNTFLSGTPNQILYNRWYFSESGYVTAAVYSRDGRYIIVGHSTGLIQMRHGATGAVMCTLRNIQFPPKPVYALEYSRTEARVCYAACMDGAVYRIEIPDISLPSDAAPLCIRADPALECLNMQFYGAPGASSHSVPFVTQRSPALSLGLTSDQTKLIVGYADTSIKVFDMETQEAEMTYKVHKLRLQFIPKKLQRMHFGQVCALKCHDDRPFVFASAAWDKTLRVWDTRCSIGCMMTFEGVDVCSNSVDLNRDHVIAGSWQTTDALTVWDIVAKKRVSVVRVQNRRPDVDGEFIYACQFWKCNKFNRKGKYGIIGGSGTKCVEVINLHNRYITCSYPTEGSVLAITSHEDLIAFGGTAPVFTVVSFHDPKHEKYDSETEAEYVYNKCSDDMLLYDDADNVSIYSTDDRHSYASRKSK